MKIKNRDTGVQVEWKGVLVTVQTNPYHGVHVSVAVENGEKLKLLSIHGNKQGQLMPFHVHEEDMERMPDKS